MSDGKQLSAPQTAAPTIAQRHTQLSGQLEARKGEFAKLLNNDQAADRFVRIMLNVVAKQPELLDCDRASLIQASMDIANNGLMPDGKQAALVVYNTKVKVDGVDKWIKKVQALTMVKGIIEILYASGRVREVIVDVAYAGETFQVTRGDSPSITHIPDFEIRNTAGAKIIAAYCVIITKDGAKHMKALAKSKIDRARAAAKSDNVWKAHEDEMSIKTAIHSTAKIMPFEKFEDLHNLLNAEDSFYDFDKVAPAQVKTARLTANPADVIEDEPAADDAKEPQTEAKVESTKEPQTTAGSAAAASVLDDDDIPAHIRDAPPIEGTLVVPAQREVVENKAVDAQERIVPAQQETADVHPIVAKVADMRSWISIDVYLQQLWKTDEWFALEDAEQADAVLIAISKLPVFEFADEGTLAYGRIKRALKGAE